MAENIIILASGTQGGGGTGTKKLIRYFGETNPSADIVGIVSNHAAGGIARIAADAGIPFRHIANEALTPEMYESIAGMFDVENPLFVLSGWLRFVHMRRNGVWGWILRKMGRNRGLESARAVNVHPALLSKLSGRFGGKGMYGARVHEAVASALEKGELDEVSGHNGEQSVAAYSGFTMHFLSGEYDRGPVCAEVTVRIQKGMSPKEIAAAVQAAEHMWYPMFVEMVALGQIRLEKGRVIAPLGYQIPTH